MASDSQSWLDPVNVAILNELQKDARLSHSELARRVKLSAPSVSERVRRLEDAGLITGYHAKVPAQALGLGITAFVQVSYPSGRSEQMYGLAARMAEIRECYHVAGEVSVILKVQTRDIEHLEATLQHIQVVGSTQTSIVMSAPVIKEQFDLSSTR